MAIPNINDYGIVFGGQDVVAIVLPYTPPAADLQVWRTQFAATQGISEIIGGSGGRMIDIPLVLRHSSYTTRAKIEADIATFNSVIGINDTLKVYLYDGTILNYANCTCHGFAMMTDPKPDQANTMGAGVGRWTCTVMGRFYQTLTT